MSLLGRSMKMLPLLATLSFAQLNSSSIIELPVSRFPDPECSYKVLHNSANGPLVTSRINLGDPVFHKWACKYPRQGGSDIYCMMVHSCTVESANHKDPVEIIDEFGCPRDSAIPEIIYQNDLTAGLLVGAFSLEYGEPAIYFKCRIYQPRELDVFTYICVPKSRLPKPNLYLHLKYKAVVKKQRILSKTDLPKRPSFSMEVKY